LIRASVREEGFTLVELLVALLIFGMLSAAGVALLTFSVQAQDMADERLGEVAAIRRTGALLTGDLAQAAPRLVRDEAGAVRPAFVGGTGADGDIALALVRRGWDNPDGVSRPSLQKVEYRLVEDRLERTAYRHLDGAEPMGSATILKEVESLSLRYRDAEGAWRERWDPTEVTDLPRAVEIAVDLGNGAPIRQLFLVGTDAS
jgi:general secretion pathway protein J